MARFALCFLAVVAGNVVLSTPAAAQIRDGFSSLTHAVSVTLEPRVKVKVRALSKTTSRNANLALSVRANRSWVLAAADSVVASGTGSSAVDTTVLVGTAFKPRSSHRNDPIVLTISAP